MNIWNHAVRRWLVYAAITAAAALLGVVLGRVSFVQTLGLRAMDAQFILRGKMQPPPEVVLLVIDHKTYDNIPDVQLFWHPVYAEAIRATADGGAKVLGLDIAFAVPVQKWEPDHDRLLAEAAAETAARMPVVIGYVPGAVVRQQEWPVPVNIIMSALGLTGFVNLTADADSFIRRQELIEAPDPNAPGPDARSFSLRVVEKYLGQDAVYDGNILSLAGRRIPVSADRAMTINYAGPAGTFSSISLWDFLQAARAGNRQQLRHWVAGKIVLLGVDHITDRFPTPFYMALSGSRWTMAGVEIHGNIISTIRSGNYLTPVSSRGQASAAAAVAIGTVIVMAYTGGVAAGLWISALLIAIVAITQVVFRLGAVLSLPELLIACVSAIAMTGVYRLTTSQRRSELFGRALRVFVGHEVASQLDEAGRITLKGTHEYLTILFSDIRDFTSFCEEKDPAVVVEILNAYFARMVAIITAHGGVVNKFIGDGMLIIFSDRDNGAQRGDHASRAVRCGVAICGVKTGFETRVGIHTGVVVIGIVGSTDRIEYTVLGNTVNLASRIEAANKDQQTQLLMSESTRDLLEPEIQTIPVGAVSIRGQSRKINLYTAAVAAKSATVASRQD
jgi:class 3 adenylate cyclase/CHASE2 domain-containing sensor protein